MWGRGKKAETPTGEPPNVLKSAVREARIEAAERSAVVVDLRDADVARLELLNDALDPAFKDIPKDVELFDRGVSKGDVPRSNSSTSLGISLNAGSSASLSSSSRATSASRRSTTTAERSAASMRASRTALLSTFGGSPVGVSAFLPRPHMRSI